jgi:hypothetical protein
VLAIGSGSNLFDTPGAESAYLLERTEDAERFHGRLLAAFMRAPFSTDKALRVAIVGGGATGVELSAELIEAHNELQDGLGAEQRFRLEISHRRGRAAHPGRPAREDLRPGHDVRWSARACGCAPAPRSSPSIPIDWRPATATSRPT